MSHDSLLRIQAGYGMDGWVHFQKGAGILLSITTPKGPLCLLFSEYWGLFSRGQCDRNLKLTIHLHLVQRSEEPLYVLIVKCLITREIAFTLACLVELWSLKELYKMN
jgi:hypothetical protein